MTHELLTPPAPLPPGAAGAGGDDRCVSNPPNIKPSSGVQTKIYNLHYQPRRFSVCSLYVRSLSLQQPFPAIRSTWDGSDRHTHTHTHTPTRTHTADCVIVSALCSPRISAFRAMRSRWLLYIVIYCFTFFWQTVLVVSHFESAQRPDGECCCMRTGCSHSTKNTTQTQRTFFL